MTQKPTLKRIDEEDERGRNVRGLGRRKTDTDISQERYLLEEIAATKIIGGRGGVVAGVGAET